MKGREKSWLAATAMASALIFLFPADVASAGDAGDGEASASTALEVVIVTARKREESLLEIPESVAAITGDDIDRQNLKGLEQVGFQVPNLNLSMRLDGFPNVSIRGLGSFGNTQGVGFYLDDTQIFSDASSRFGDLERIEVLKGPQGTLYGGSNIGGAVKFVSVRPDSEEASGRIKLLGGEQGTQDAEVHVNLPLGDAGWAARAFVFAASDDGYIKNTNPPRANGMRGNNPTNVGAVDERGGRVSITGSLSERLSLYAAFRYNEYEGPNNTWVREMNANSLQHPDVVNNSIAGHHERDTKAGLIELTLELEGMDVLWLTSFTDTFSSRYTDIDIREEYLFDLLRPEEMKVTTHELRFTSTGDGPLQWLGGVYHSAFDEVMNAYIWWFDTVEIGGQYSGNAAFLFGSEDVSGWWWGDVPDPGRELQSVRTPAELRDRDKSHLAAFASMSYDLGDWDLGLGLRMDKWKNESLNRDLGIAAQQEDTELLPRLSLTRWFSENAMVYGLASWGYEPGGFNLASFQDTEALIPFGREEAVNYELGWKIRSESGRASGSLAVFFIDYEARQIEYHLVQEDGDPIEAITNFGDSEQVGFEAELSVQATEWLSLTFVAGSISAEWTNASFDPGDGSGVQDLTGKPPPVTPEFSWGFSADYRRPVNERVQFLGALQISHNGEYQGLQAWNPVTNPAFNVVNGQAGFLWENMEVVLHVENLLDEKYYNDVQHFFNGHDLIGLRGEPGAIVIGTLGQPRLTTMSFSYYF